MKKTGLEYLSDDLILQIFHSLNFHDSLALSSINQKFRRLVVSFLSNSLLPHCLENIQNLLLNSTLIRIDGTKYLSCEKPPILFPWSEIGVFYGIIVRKYISPFKPKEIVSALIKANDNFNIKDIIDRLLPCFSGDVEAMNLLIDHGADVNFQDYWGYTALHYACQFYDRRNKYIPLKAVLIKKMIEKKFNFGLRNCNGSQVIEIVLKQYDQPNLKDRKVSDDEIEVIGLILSNSPQESYRLLGNIKDRSIIERLEKYVFGVLEIYKKIGSEIKVESSDIKPQSQKIMRISPEFILRISDDLKIVPPEQQITARVACITGLLNHKLIFENVESPIQSFFEVMKLLFSGFSSTQILSELINSGFNINTTFFSGLSLMHLFSVLDRELSSVFRLLEMGVSLYVRDSLGMTPLHYILMFTDISEISVTSVAQFVHLMSEKGYRFTSKNNRGLTPVDIFIRRYNKEWSVATLEILAFLLANTYINPIDALGVFGISDQFLIEMTQKFMPKDNDIFNELLIFSEETLPFVNLKEKSNKPDWPKITHQAIRLDLNDDLSSLSESEQLTVKAYRVMALVYLSKYDEESESIRCIDGDEFCAEGNSLLNFYHDKVSKVIKPFTPIAVAEEIKKINFDLHISGCFGQNVAHFFATLDAQSLQIVLNAGANPNQPDGYGETTIQKFVLMLTDNNYRHFTSLEMLQVLISYNVDLNVKIDDVPIIEFIIDHLDECIVTAESTAVTAYLLVKLCKDPIGKLEDFEDKKFVAPLIGKILEYSHEKHTTEEDIKNKKNQSDATFFKPLSNKESVQNFIDNAQNDLLPDGAKNVANLITNCRTLELEEEYISCDSPSILVPSKKLEKIYFEMVPELMKGHEPIEIVTILLKNGFKINSQGIMGTLLHFFIRDKKTTVFLLENGIDVNLVDVNGCTALHYAFKFFGSKNKYDSPSLELVKRFKDNKFDFTKVNSNDDLVIDIIFNQYNYGEIEMTDEKIQIMGFVLMNSPADAFAWLKEDEMLVNQLKERIPDFRNIYKKMKQIQETDNQNSSNPYDEFQVKLNNVSIDNRVGIQNLFDSLFFLSNEADFGCYLIAPSGKKSAEIILNKYMSCRDDVRDSVEMLQLLAFLLINTYHNPMDIYDFFGLSNELLKEITSNFLQIDQKTTYYQRVIYSLPQDPWMKKIIPGISLGLSDHEFAQLEKSQQLRIKAFRMLGYFLQNVVGTIIPSLDDKKSDMENASLLNVYRYKALVIIQPFKPAAIISDIIALGFDVRQQNKRRETLLDFVVTMDDVDALQLLTSKGVDINGEDLFNQTAFHKFIFMLFNKDYQEFASLEVLKFLISNGANLDIEINKLPLKQFIINNINICLEKNDENIIQTTAFLLVSCFEDPLLCLPQSNDDKSLSEGKELLILFIRSYANEEIGLHQKRKSQLIDDKTDNKKIKSDSEQQLPDDESEHTENVMRM